MVLSKVASLPDGRLAGGYDDGMIRIWDLASGKRVATLRGHESRVNDLAVLKDGRLAAASGHTIALWNPSRSVVLE